MNNHPQKKFLRIIQKPVTKCPQTEDRKRKRIGSFQGNWVGDQFIHIVLCQNART